MRYLKLLILTFILYVACEKEQVPPVANFVPELELKNFSVYIVDKGQTVHFKNLSQNADSYLWDFGDGTTSTQENPDHTFNSAGWQNVVLKAFNGAISEIKEIRIFVKNITVMTYNIFESGGEFYEFYGWDSWPEDANSVIRANTNRFSDILTIIREVNPDILALQETWLWDLYEPKYYIRIADSLNMPYYYFIENGEAENYELCIYSKFPINSTDFLSTRDCITSGEYLINGAYTMKVELQISDGLIIDFFNCHLWPEDDYVKSCEVETLPTYVEASTNKHKILAGDMNFYIRPDRPDYQLTYMELLQEAGINWLADLNLLDFRELTSLDQIWATDNAYENSIYFDYHYVQGGQSIDDSSIGLLLTDETKDLLPTAADHMPVVAYFGIE